MNTFSTFANMFSKETFSAEKIKIKEAKRSRSYIEKIQGNRNWNIFKKEGKKEANEELKNFRSACEKFRKSTSDRKLIKFSREIERLVRKYFKLFIKALRWGLYSIVDLQKALKGMFFIGIYTLNHPSEKGLKYTSNLTDKDLEEDNDDEEIFNEVESDSNEIKDAQIISEEVYDQFGNLAEGGKEKIIKIARSATNDNIKPCPNQYCLPEPSMKVLSSGAYAVEKYQESSSAATRRTVHDNIIDVIADNLFMEAIINGENISPEQCYEIAKKLIKMR